MCTCAAGEQTRVRRGPGATHVLQAAAVRGEALVEGDGEALVVLPVGDARGDHPLLLLLGGGLARGAAQHGRRRARRAARDLLVLEARRLERVLDDLGHLDDALLERGAARLLAGRVAHEARGARARGDVRGLRGPDLAVHERLERGARALRRRAHVRVRGARHVRGAGAAVRALRERDEVRELRLHEAPRAVALLRERVVAHRARAVDLQRERVPRRGLRRSAAARGWGGGAHLFAAHVERVLRDGALGEGAAVAKVGGLRGAPRAALPVRRGGALRGGRRRALAWVVVRLVGVGVDGLGEGAGGGSVSGCEASLGRGLTRRGRWPWWCVGDFGGPHSPTNAFKCGTSIRVIWGRKYRAGPHKRYKRYYEEKMG